MIDIMKGAQNMTEYKYGYLLQVLDDNMNVIKYDYLLSNYELLNNMAVYNELSGIDLCRYDLHNEEDNIYFFDKIDECENIGSEKISILFELALSVHELAEFE